MIYQAIKHLHVTCVAISGLGFLLRAGWMWFESPWRERRLVRILPHGVDTVLLGSALTLAVLSGQYPFMQGWLTAKLGGLITYILCGTMALKHGPTRQARGIFVLLALAAYAYIVSVALTRSPLPWA